jgi:2-polyprenyl-3-methyl-5-hydroxy-6-metoxy-1,4-benzoquinol methylase
MKEENVSFEEIYSKYYDELYMDKDYGRECDFIEEVFKYFCSHKPVKILDVGCGTGGHLMPLASRGYQVLGIDKSKWMVGIAEKKIRASNLSARVLVADVLDFNLDEKFDACIAMFAVINYIVQTENLIKAFKNLRRHLRQGALFIFDYWYGPAVLNIKPSARVKVVGKDGVKIIRTAVPELDTFSCVQKINYYLIAIEGRKVVDETREVHILRYLFPQELTHYLKEAGFKVLKFCEFPYLYKPPNENTWNVATIAAAQ